MDYQSVIFDPEFDFWFIASSVAIALLFNVIFQFIMQGSLTAAFLLTWNWFPFLISAPLTCNNKKLYVEQKNLVYATEIFGSTDNVNYRRVKLGFYFILKSICVIRLLIIIDTLLSDAGVIYKLKQFWSPN